MLSTRGRARKRTQEIAVAFDKIEIGKRRGRLPSQIVKYPILRLPAESANPKKEQQDGIFAWVGVFVPGDLFAGGILDAQFLIQFAGQRLGGRFSRLDLAPRKFPLQRMRLMRLPLSDQDPPLPFQDRRHHFNHVNILEHMYSERLLDHFQNPRNVGELPAPAVTVEVSNPACGDILRLSVRFEGDVAVDARYKVRGCTASIAAGSALAEWIPGKTRAALGELRMDFIEESVGGLAPESRHAAVLCLDGVKQVLRRAGSR